MGCCPLRTFTQTERRLTGKIRSPLKHRAPACRDAPVTWIIVYCNKSCIFKQNSSVQELRVVPNALFLHCTHSSHKGFGRRYLHQTRIPPEVPGLECSRTWRNSASNGSWQFNTFFFLPSKETFAFIKNTQSLLKVFIVVSSVSVRFYAIC